MKNNFSDTIKEETAIVKIDGKEFLFEKGVLLSDILSSEKPCGAHAKCGKCKVIAKGNLSAATERELELLTKDELAKNIRLSCLTYVLGECEITTLSKTQNDVILTNGKSAEFELKPTFSKFGAAFDIGTTTLAAKLYDTNGVMLAESSKINPQKEWGSDVISRIESALSGKAKKLSNSIRYAICEMTEELSSQAGISAKEIDSVVITANTVMLSLLTEESAEPFSHAPFKSKRLFGETLSAESLDLFTLEKNVPIYLPPCISAFVGADVACAILASELCKNDTAMLFDIGTNGEMALWNKEKKRLTVCSTAAGPAFEGVGISMGMRGSTGAIDKVTFENGNFYSHVIGECLPVGICGSGLVDAVAAMLDANIIDESGYLEEDKFVIHPPVSLVPKDIRALQLAKSAIYAGAVTLMESERISSNAVSTVYIAGGFGNYINKISATRIGLLPKDLAKKSYSIGNGALSGAAMLLLNSDARSDISKLIANAKVLDLASNQIFSNYYMSAMALEEM